MAPSEDNIFRESSMSFGDHLEELRGCIFRAIAGVFVCFLIGLFVGAPVMNIIQQPLNRSLGRFIEKRNQKKIQTIIDQGYPADIAEKANKGGLLVETVYLNKAEITKTLYGIEASPQFAPKENQAEKQIEGSKTTNAGTDSPQGEAKTPAQTPAKAADKAGDKTVNKTADKASGKTTDKTALLNTNTSIDNSKENDKSVSFNPWEAFKTFWNAGTGNMPKAATAADQKAYKDNRNPDEWVEVYVWKPKEESEKTRTRALSTQEPFMIYLKASFLVGAILSCPWVFYQVWMFVISGLYPHERKYVYVFFPMSVFLFLAGALMAFFWVFDSVLAFLLLFNDMMNIEPELRINEWLGFVLMLPLGFGISFQLPLVMLFMERIGIFTVQSYIANWRLSILGIAIISMVLTPADPTSMLLMFVPLTFLFFLGLLLCIYMPKLSPQTEEE